jgi:two-component system, cell cycle response regulator DivK
MSNQATILIVEDNPTNLKLASAVLEFDGYKVLRATDTNEAVRVLHTALPDLILLDLQIPGRDGFSLTRQLKADRKFKQIKIVALTAFAMRGDSQKAYDAGCDGYITKPIDTHRLTEQVAGFLENGGKMAATCLNPEGSEL